jgi:hypothetical protein
MNGANDQLETDLEYPLPRHGDPPIFHAILYEKYLRPQWTCMMEIGNENSNLTLVEIIFVAHLDFKDVVNHNQCQKDHACD